MRRVILLAAVALVGGAAQQAPQINIDGIVPNQSGVRPPLEPGMEVSLYGRRLGPAAGCTANAGIAGEAKEICGTTVTVGGIPAALIYVQENQINLRVPFNVPVERMLPFAVTREGRTSPPVSAQVGLYVAAITPPPVAYVDMPIWVEVQLPDPLAHSLRYPVTIRPADFGGHRFEVRRNGVLLSPTSPRHPLPVAGSGPGGYGTVGSGSLLGLPHEPENPRRLPLHLLYRFDMPGPYELRYVGYDYRYPMEKHILVHSPWITVQVAPLPPGMRQTWLVSMQRSKPAGPVEWLSDYLPSLLAVPDSAVLPLLKDAVYHPDERVRQYALYSLSLFDDALLASWLPSTIQAGGPTVDLAYLLSWRRDLFQSRGSEIVRAVLPYLASRSPVRIAGALQTLYFLKPQYDWKQHPEIPALVDRAVVNQAGRLIATHNPAVLQPLALYLGTWKAEASRRLLRRLIAEGTVREQAEICLRWIGDAPAQ